MAFFAQMLFPLLHNPSLSTISLCTPEFPRKHPSQRKRMHPLQAPFRTCLHAPWLPLTGISQAEAMRAYIKGKPAQPCGRFGHGTAVSGNTLYMYGGHDGGFSKTGRQNYDPGGALWHPPDWAHQYEHACACVHVGMCACVDKGHKS